MANRSERVVYVTYRWKGAKEAADRIATRIREGFSSASKGFEIIVDSASLHPGDVWPASLQHSLDRADVVVVILDRNWVRHADEYGRRRIDDQDDWVRLELEKALASRKSIFLALVDGAGVPPAEALPPSLSAITTLPAFELASDSFEADVTRLAEKVIHAARHGAEANPLPQTIPFRVLNLEISNFRCFEHLLVDLAAPSSLLGEWTCIAGINGAGKSSILQALALLLMGPNGARELGGKRLQSLRRTGKRGAKSVARLKARVQHLGEVLSLEMSIDDRGPKAADRSFWSYANELLIAGYGASRNLSESRDRDDKYSGVVGAAITLFDPMARLQGAESILRDRPSSAAGRKRTQKLLSQAIAGLFGDDIQVTSDSRKRLAFAMGGPKLNAQDLPDGFRSSISWIADLCERWSTVEPKRTDIREVTGLVMIDEVDLHLHATLQRAIVPRLRDCFPGVQFVVTSHSPLILSSFDQNELIVLDRDEDDGIRELDRQVLGFTPDQIYEWLLGTPTTSEAMEGIMAEAYSAPEKRRRDLAEILRANPRVGTEEARKQSETIKARIETFKK